MRNITASSERRKEQTKKSQELKKKNNLWLSGGFLAVTLKLFYAYL